MICVDVCVRGYAVWWSFHQLIKASVGIRAKALPSHHGFIEGFVDVTKASYGRLDGGENRLPKSINFPPQFCVVKFVRQTSRS